MAAQTHAIEAEQHLRRIQASGIQPGTWDVRISAEPSSGSVKTTKLLPNQRLVHFQRHGQGFHNLLGDLYRKLGAEFDATGKDRANSPYCLPEVLDPPLTELGRQQCKEQQNVARKLSPEVIFTSPLCRAVQTALLTYHELLDEVPVIALEEAREQCGVHTCDRRRPISESSYMFPQVDFSAVNDEEDALWLSLGEDRRESVAEEAARIYSLLITIRDRTEVECALTTHSAFLFTMFNSVSYDLQPLLTADCRFTVIIGHRGREKALGRTLVFLLHWRDPFCCHYLQ